jgi:beta-RFAP synthase
MIDRVSVRCTARLHLGFLDLNGSLGRRFGSVGLALDDPATFVSIARAATMSVSGLETERAARHLATIETALGVGSHALTVAEAIPAHSGLGSGTQLALAIATAVRGLHGLSPNPEADAALLGRGGRSGIGIGLFAQGGLVVDGGHGSAPPPPPISARVSVPAGWRILLLIDRAAHGLSGQRETDAFADLPPMSDATVGRLCRLVMMAVLPALAEADIFRFGAAIAEMQAIVGDYFAPAQGGRFSSQRVAAALAALADAGAHGVGQSSWGPTGFAFAPSEAEACRLKAAIADRATAAGLDIMVRRALNRGAEMIVEPAHRD